MGLGGELCWSAVARELNERTGRCVIPVRKIDGGFQLVESEIFRNNPRFSKSVTDIPLILNNPNSNYCKLDTPSHATHRYDRHIIEQYCEPYGIMNPKLKCELFFDDKELDKIDELEFSIGKPFIVIEPNVKNEYGVNKEYPFEKWQYVASELIDKNITVVQVGTKGSRIISEDVISLIGKTSFRTAAGLLKRASLLIASEGGLMHAANAVDIPAVIVVTGFISPKLACYPKNENIWIGERHGPCGMKTRCEKCAADAAAHDPDEIVRAIMRKMI